MTPEPLPTFKYHPDPVATGSVVASKTKCACCGRARGYVYAGPVYAEDEYDKRICPWCIADGSAHEKLDATFVDDISVPGVDFPDAADVDEAIVEEVANRTPGFAAWQQEQWATCCGDAAAFVGRAGRQELKAFWPEAKSYLQESLGLVGDDWTNFYKALSKDAGPTAYVFRCLHCQRLMAYSDTD